MAWTHGVAAAASVAAGTLFVQVGILLLRRATRPNHGEAGAGGALLALGVWWLGIGVTTWTNAGLVLAGVTGNLAGALWARLAGIAAAGAAMWGIIAYLAYLHTGRSTASAPTAVAYGLLVAGTGLHVLRSSPQTLLVGDWTVDLRGEPTGAGLAVDAVLTLAFLLPPVVAGLLLLRLRRGIGDAAQRRRSLVVGAGIPLWVLLHLLARLNDGDAWQFLTRVVVGVAVALAVAWAYVDGPSPRSAGADDDAIQRRVRDLV